MRPSLGEDDDVNSYHEEDFDQEQDEDDMIV